MLHSSLLEAIVTKLEVRQTLWPTRRMNQTFPGSVPSRQTSYEGTRQGAGHHTSIHESTLSLGSEGGGSLEKREFRKCLPQPG